jgi:hypothetical protein
MLDVMDSELLSVHEVAKLLGKTEGAIRGRIQRDEIPTVRWGKRGIMIRRDVVLRMLRGEPLQEA